MADPTPKGQRPRKRHAWLKAASKKRLAPGRTGSPKPGKVTSPTTAQLQVRGFLGLPLWTELLIVVAFTLLVTVPFIMRPFHMDDAGFLELARERQNNPVEMVIHDYTFFGQQNESFIDTHPPLVSSYLALLMYVTGDESETAMHLGFLIFPLIASVSMYFLARMFTGNALMAALLLVATPGVMVMSQGLMSDMPGLSFWLAGIALYVYGLKRQSLTLMALCGIVITVGVFTSYQVLSVVPLLVIYAMIRREMSVLAAIPFALPLSAFASFCVWHYTQLSVLPRFSYGVGEPMVWYSVVQKGAAAFAALAGAAIFFAVLMRALLVRKWDLAVYVVFLVPLWVSIIIQYAEGRFTIWAAVLSLVFMPLGILLLYTVFARGWKELSEERRDKLAGNVLLLLWLAGVLFYVVILLPYSSVRYLLPAFPPLILLFVRMVEDRFHAGRGQRNLLVASVVATALLGLFVAEADYELAAANRDFAADQGAALGREAAGAGGQVWFVGEFGFRYYMEQQGFKELPLVAVDDLQKGDIIVQSPLADPRPFSDEVADRVKLVDRVDYPGTNPLKTLNFAADAGFYGHFWGILPFSVDTGDIEQYQVYRVDK